MIELIAPDGYMYVNHSHRIMGYCQFCPDQQAADLWTLTPEEEALALEAKWIAEDEEALLQQTEGDN